MPVLSAEGLKRHKRILTAMDDERRQWFSHWREVSDYFLPRRYPWLLSEKESGKRANLRNKKLLDSTSTLAIRTLASGMMNGITSPARPWFRLRLKGVDEDAMDREASMWLEQATKTLYTILAESNFYNSVALLYLEWCCFGTASLGIYEDEDTIIRCYNYALGEFYLSQDSTGRVGRHGRMFTRTVEQLVEEFGEENVSERVRGLYNRKDGSLYNEVKVAHLIEKNIQDDHFIRGGAPFREFYWEVSSADPDTKGGAKYLSASPTYEWPTVSPRWEIQGNDSYGTSPAMDALADVIELQHIRLKRGIGLGKQVSPPMIVDQQLRNRPKALGEGGITYASSANANFGARPAVQVQLPYAELQNDIMELQARIRETLHNNLFNMISQLETVRSASEIDARREEKLVHLGPVLQRFYSEGLDPALSRVFGIAMRRGMFGEIPSALDNVEIDVQYVSILSDAQRAVGVTSIERFMGFVGNLSSIYPEATNVPNVDELIRDYAEGIGIKPSGLNDRETSQQNTDAAKELEALAQSAAVGKDMAQGAKVLADTDVGGGANALQQMMG